MLILSLSASLPLSPTRSIFFFLRSIRLQRLALKQYSYVGRLSSSSRFEQKTRENRTKNPNMFLFSPPGSYQQAILCDLRTAAPGAHWLNARKSDKMGLNIDHYTSDCVFSGCGCRFGRFGVITCNDRMLMSVLRVVRGVLDGACCCCCCCPGRAG